MAIRITCINKDAGNHENAHVAISIFGWIEDDTNDTGKTNRLVMYEWVKNGGKAYVKDSKGDIAYLISAETAKRNKICKNQTRWDKS